MALVDDEEEIEALQESQRNEVSQARLPACIYDQTRGFGRFRPGAMTFSQNLNSENRSFNRQ